MINYINKLQSFLWKRQKGCCNRQSFLFCYQNGRPLLTRTELRYLLELNTVAYQNGTQLLTRMKKSCYQNGTPMLPKRNPVTYQNGTPMLPKRNFVTYYNGTPLLTRMVHRYLLERNSITYQNGKTFSTETKNIPAETLNKRKNQV